MARRTQKKSKPRKIVGTVKKKRTARAIGGFDARPDPGWDRLENALAAAAPRGKSRTAAQAEVDRLFDEDEKQHLQRLARRAKLARSRAAPLGNVVFLPGITGSNLDVTHASGDKDLSLIHISEPTRLALISFAVFCL
jgi:hypothetical protein